MSRVLGPPGSRVQSQSQVKVGPQSQTHVKVVRFEPMNRVEAVAVLKKLGVVVNANDILATEQIANDTYRVILAKNGVAAEVLLIKEGSKWRRSYLRLHELIKFVDLGVKVIKP